MSKKILVVGGGPLQTPLIKKINALGYTSLCVDKNPEAVGFQYAQMSKPIDIIDKEACLKFAKEQKIDGVLTVATDFPIETVAYIAQEMHLVGLPLATAKLVKNKYQVRKTLFENKVGSKNQFFEIDEKTDVEMLKQKIKYPVIVKPCDGSGSKSIEKVTKPEQLERAIKEAQKVSISKKAFIETFVEGKEYGVESFVVDGKPIVLGIMKKQMTLPPYYAELGHSIPSGLSFEVENRIEEVVKKAIIALGITCGSVNMDLILSKENEPYIIDVGARMGGNLIGSHIIPNATGVNVMENLAKQSVGDEVDVSFKWKRPIATRILNFTPGIIQRIGNIQDLIDGEEVLDIVLNAKVGDEVHTYRTNADSCGWVVVSKRTPEETETFAEKVKEKIRQQFEIV